MGQLITMYMLRVYSMCVDMYVYVVMMVVIMITINRVMNHFQQIEYATVYSRTFTMNMLTMGIILINGDSGLMLV